MSLNKVIEQIRVIVNKALYDLKFEKINFDIFEPPKKEFGDLTTNVSFLLGKKIQKKPYEIARQLVDECKPYFRCFYEEKDTIGRRYRRQDATGTPFCATIDHQTKEDGTVTLRNRDTMTQDRIHIAAIKDEILKMIL